MHLIRVPFTLLVFFVAMLHAQYTGWINYAGAETVGSIVEQGPYFWIGTNGGLVRFEKATGSKTVYTHANSGLPANWVEKIALDPSNGDLIVSVDGELLRFDGIAAWSTILPYSIRDIAIGSDSTIWVVCAEKCMVTRIKNGTVREFGLSKNVGAMAINGITIDRANRAWVHLYSSDIYDERDDQFARISDTIVLSITLPGVGQSSKVIKVRSFTLDSKNHLWAFIDEAGLAEYDGTQWLQHARTPPEPISAISIDTSDSIMYLLAQGMVISDGDTWRIVPHPAGEFDLVSFPQVRSDNSGNLWVFSPLSGLSRFANRQWEVIDVPVDAFRTYLSSYRFGGVYIDDRNGRWVYGNTLAQWNSNFFTSYDISSFPFRYNRIDEIRGCGDGAIWFSSFYQLLRTRNDTCTDFTPTDTNLNAILKFRIDTKGMPWVLASADNDSRNVLYRFVGGSWKLMPRSGDNDCFHYWRDFLIDSANIVWAIESRDANSSSLIRYNGMTKDTISCPLTDFISGYPFKMEMTPDGSLWFASENKGLLRYSQGAWSAYNGEKAPFHDNTLGSLVQAPDHALWMGGLNGGGIYRFDGTRWNSYDSTVSPYLKRWIEIKAVDGHNRVWFQIKQSINALGMFDGDSVHLYTTQNSGISGNLVSSVAVDPAGRVWIGHYGSGISLFDPDVKVQKVTASRPCGNTGSPLQIVVRPDGRTVSVRVRPATVQAVTIELIDLRGRVVEKFVACLGAQDEGKFTFATRPAQGIYCCRVIAGTSVVTTQFTIVTR